MSALAELWWGFTVSRLSVQSPAKELMPGKTLLLPSSTICLRWLKWELMNENGACEGGGTVPP